MVIKIDKKKWIHYLLIYFLIIVNQSCLYEYFLNSDLIRFSIFLFFSFLLLIKFKKLYYPYIIFIGVLLISVIFTRLIHGGIGITAWIGYAIPILVCLYTISYDKDNFLDRFIKITTLLAFIGIILFLLQILFPELLKKILFFKYTTKMEYKIWQDSYTYSTQYYKGYGLLIYSFRDGGDALMRNKGIFTESGVCQMLYNSALFVLLFLSNEINIKKSDIKKYILILILAIITVQSTTGYIVMSVLLISFLLSKNNERIYYKLPIFMFIIIGILFLGFDYISRGDKSFLSIAIFDKFFNRSNEFEIHGNGMIRTNTALLSLKIMFSNFFGIGADKFLNLQKLEHLTGGGAGFFTFGATIGLIPFLLSLIMYINPLINTEMKKNVKITLIFMIFWSLSAQSNPFYTLLLIFPVYYSIQNYYKKNRRKI